MYSYRRWLEAWNFRFRKERDGTIYVANTKALISFAVTAKLICFFVFAYAKCWFSHDATHIGTCYADEVLKSTHNLCYRAILRKIMYTPVNANFCNIKVGLGGSKSHERLA